MLKRQRYHAIYLANGALPIYGVVCTPKRRANEEQQPLRVIARFLGVDGGFPIYGFARCDFPRIGRYLMRYLGMHQGKPVYGLACCDESSSGSSGSSGTSGYSG